MQVTPRQQQHTAEVQRVGLFLDSKKQTHTPLSSFQKGQKAPRPVFHIKMAWSMHSPSPDCTFTSPNALISLPPPLQRGPSLWERLLKVFNNILLSFVRKFHFLSVDRQQARANINMWIFSARVFSNISLVLGWSLRENISKKQVLFLCPCQSSIFQPFPLHTRNGNVRKYCVLSWFSVTVFKTNR